jgi:hypothetical protein
VDEPIQKSSTSLDHTWPVLGPKVKQKMMYGIIKGTTKQVTKEQYFPTHTHKKKKKKGISNLPL